MRYARRVRAGGVVLSLCVFAALVASAGKGARSEAPCTLAAHRLPSGRGLSLSFRCTTGDVEMLRVDFPKTVRLVGRASLTEGVCRDSTPRSLFCVFPSGDPVAVDTPLAGTVRFKVAAPRARQHGQVSYYLPAPGGPAGPGTIDTTTPETATFSY